MKLRLLVVAAALATLLAAPARAQRVRPLSLELHGGAGVPLGSFRKLADAGPSWGASLDVRLTRLLGLYAGYDRDTFGTDAGADLSGHPLDGDVRSTTLRTGVQWTIPVRRGPIEPFIRTGVLFDHVTARFDDGGASPDEASDRITAFNVEVGAGISFARSVAFVPGVRYYSIYPAFDVTNPDARVEMHLQYLALTLGLRVSP